MSAEKTNYQQFKNPELAKMRHTTEHLLHDAARIVWPHIQLAMGPATDDGFYFDFDPITANGEEFKVNEDDFTTLEDKMNWLKAKNLSLTEEEVTIEQAKEIFSYNPYKLDTLNKIENRSSQQSDDSLEIAAEKITLYWTGDKGLINGDFSKLTNGYYLNGDDFVSVDLCAGPHVSSTGEVGEFKLLSVAGAYWQGDENNKMLTRIYGTAFENQEELDEYLHLQEEAKKRDHKRIGQEMELFMFHETSPGMPYWLPKGFTLYNELLKFWREEHKKYNYQETATPLLNKKALYETSGHWEHYRDDMFIADMGENEVYGVKPMNCPNAMIIFGSKLRSYRELPLRLSDSDRLHRYELSGTLNGLLRIRSFQQDDSHNFISEDMIESEYENIFEITEKFYSIFGLDYKFRLGTRPEGFLGDIETWNKAEDKLRNVLEKSSKDFFVLEGDGAFYGPKVDILMNDALGREWQMGTIQLDFQQPLRFGLKYIDTDGSEKTPVVIHRVIYGSLERFIGIIIEHFAGAFPVWLHPEQVRIIPIGQDQYEYAHSVHKQLLEKDIRATEDPSNDTLNARIRKAQLEKIPYMLIIGGREEENGTVSVRLRTEENLGAIAVEEFLERILDKIENKSLDL